MIKYLTVLAIVLFSLSLQAQNKKNQESDLFTEVAEWYEGSIMLRSGEELIGSIMYNSRIDKLSYRDGSIEKFFSPSTVDAFEFFDESIQKQRVFYSLNYLNRETNVERPLYFEILKEYESFAVLLRADRINVEEVHTPSTRPSAVVHQPSYVMTSKTVISQTETIYLMKSTGEIKPYFTVTKSDDGEKTFVFFGKDTETRNKMIDRDLLEEFVTPGELEKLITYSEGNNLKFKRKDDFLKILEYYDTLVEN